MHYLDTFDIDLTVCLVGILEHYRLAGLYEYLITIFAYRVEYRIVNLKLAVCSFFNRNLSGVLSAVYCTSVLACGLFDLIGVQTKIVLGILDSLEIDLVTVICYCLVLSFSGKSERISRILKFLTCYRLYSREVNTSICLINVSEVELIGRYILPRGRFCLKLLIICNIEHYINIVLIRSIYDIGGLVLLNYRNQFLNCV